MSEVLELDPSSLCVAVHSALSRECPVCDAKPQECCIEEGEELPVYAVHIGRETGGLPLSIEHTGEYEEDGSGVFRAIDN